MEEFNLNKYHKSEYKDLQKISTAYERVKTILYNADFNEDIIDFILRPFEQVLEHNGVNLREENF